MTTPVTNADCKLCKDQFDSVGGENVCKRCFDSVRETVRVISRGDFYPTNIVDYFRELRDNLEANEHGFITQTQSPEFTLLRNEEIAFDRQFNNWYSSAGD